MCFYSFRQRFAGSLAVILVVCLAKVNHVEGQTEENEKKSAVDLIKMRGFGVEMYALNSHGVPLTLYRLVNPLADPKTLNKYPVLYGHGILFDVSSMITRSEHSKPRKPVIGEPTIAYEGSMPDGSNDYSLPFMFSNNNFDVWLYDSRGTNENNRNLSDNINFSQSQKFWDFSLDEESLVDLPMMMDFVLAKTNSKKLIYVGYSESTFYMFALLTTVPDYADKVAAFIAMAPICYVSNIKGFTLPILGPIAAFSPDFLQYSFLPQPVLNGLDISLRSMCKVRGISNLICGSIIDGIGGKGTGERTPDFFRDFFKSTSLKAIKHLLQLFLAKRFGMYDYGLVENMKKYGQAHPPAYDLGKIKSDRIILVRGLTDFLSTPEDQSRIILELGTKPFLDIVLPGYNHFDFIDGRDLIRSVNAPVMKAVFQLMYKDGPTVLKNVAQAIVSNGVNSFNPINPVPPPPATVQATPQVIGASATSVGVTASATSAGATASAVVSTIN